MVSDFDNLENLLVLLWKFAELLLFTNCWRANKNWSASIVAWVFLLRNCGWLVERFFSAFLKIYWGSGWWLPRILLLSPCPGDLLGQRFASSGYGRCPLQYENHSGSRPHSFPGLNSMRSGTFPKRFRRGPELAGSWESRQHVLMRLVCGFLFCWTLVTTFLWPFPQFPQKLELCSLPAIWEHFHFVPSCS